MYCFPHCAITALINHIRNIDMTLKMVRPDSKGRITLGRLAIGISGFNVTKTKDHKIILEPYSEIPTYEKWLFENKIHTAYRIFWYYGPNKKDITILAITPHP